MVPLGTWVWLASELMFFAAIFAAYFMVREVTTNAAKTYEESLFQTQFHHINVTFAAINTAILVASSVTCQMGVFKAEPPHQAPAPRSTRILSPHAALVPANPLTGP